MNFSKSGSIIEAKPDTEVKGESLRHGKHSRLEEGLKTGGTDRLVEGFLS